MARMARVVILGLPHHVTQRGNRRQQSFGETRRWSRGEMFMSADVDGRGRLEAKFYFNNSIAGWREAFLSNVIVESHPADSLQRASK